MRLSHRDKYQDVEALENLFKQLNNLMTILENEGGKKLDSARKITTRFEYITSGMEKTPDTIATANNEKPPKKAEEKEQEKKTGRRKEEQSQPEFWTYSDFGHDLAVDYYNAISFANPKMVWDASQALSEFLGRRGSSNSNFVGSGFGSMVSAFHDAFANALVKYNQRLENMEVAIATGFAKLSGGMSARSTGGRKKGEEGEEPKVDPWEHARKDKEAGK